MAKIEILNSEYRNRKVLIIDSDESRLEKIIASFESDPSLTGLDVYHSSNLEEARLLTRKHSIELALFPQNLGDRDFVTIQQDLANANSSIQMIPMLGVPTIQQLRESRRAGGVADYGDQNDLLSFNSLKAIILGYFRDRSAIDKPDYKIMVEYSDTIKRALLVDHPNWASTKALSMQLVGLIISYYDFSQTESNSIIAAEGIYFPWLSSVEFSAVLAPDTFQLLSILNATGAWQAPFRKPSSASGLIVTLSNFIANETITGVDASNIATNIGTRPIFLKHIAIKTITPERCGAICARALDFFRASSRTG